MEKSILCAGVGGQGVLTLGSILAEASASLGKNVTYLPEYEAVMRGGASCTKINVGDEIIVSPFIEEEDILVVLHPTALEKYVDTVLDGGTIIVDSVLVENVPDYEGKTVIRVPATDIANKLNNPKGMSVVMVGAIVAGADLLPFEAASEAVANYFESKHLPVDINKAMFIEGYNYVKNL